MNTEGLSDAKLARRARILDAAQHLATRHGFRATTMEAIAHEAGLAKATIYAYFKDKEAAFVGVAERLAGDMVDAVTHELAKKGPPTERISAALIAKHSIVHDLVRTSPHATEIFGASNRLTGKLFANTDARIKTHLAKVLADTATRQNADAIARLLFASAQGIANSAPNFEIAISDIHRLVNAVVPSAKG